MQINGGFNVNNHKNVSTHSIFLSRVPLFFFFMGFHFLNLNKKSPREIIDYIFKLITIAHNEFVFLTTNKNLFFFKEKKISRSKGENIFKKAYCQNNFNCFVLLQCNILMQLVGTQAKQSSIDKSCFYGLRDQKHQPVNCVSLTAFAVQRKHKHFYMLVIRISSIEPKSRWVQSRSGDRRLNVCIYDDDDDEVKLLMRIFSDPQAQCSLLRMFWKQLTALNRGQLLLIPHLCILILITMAFGSLLASHSLVFLPSSVNYKLQFS